MSDPFKPSLRERWGVAGLIAALCLFAYGLQSINRWYPALGGTPKATEVLSGKIESINLIPSNTSTSYLVLVALQTGEKVPLVASLDRVTDCDMGTEVLIQRRGINYFWANENCSNG